MKSTLANRDQKNGIYPYLFRRSLMKLIVLAAFGMDFWLSACDHGNAGSALSAATENLKKSQPI